MAKLTGEAQYKQNTERFLDYWSTGYNGQRVTYTPGGLAWISRWGSLRYTANTAFLALIYSDWLDANGGDASLVSRYFDFAVEQINYMLGDNPQNRSYVVGFGNNSPQYPHHPTSHGSWANSLSVPTEQRHILYGALVGGPDQNDNYQDKRDDYIQNEVTTDYNAGFTGALAGLVNKFGGTPLANFPAPETRDNEIYLMAGINSSGANFIEIKTQILNQSAWPARMAENLKFRYFFTLDSGNPSDVSVQSYYNQCNSSPTGPTLYSDNIYYVEFDCSGNKI